MKIGVEKQCEKMKSFKRWETNMVRIFHISLSRRSVLRTFTINYVNGRKILNQNAIETCLANLYNLIINMRNFPIRSNAYFQRCMTFLRNDKCNYNINLHININIKRYHYWGKCIRRDAKKRFCFVEFTNRASVFRLCHRSTYYSKYSRFILYVWCKIAYMLLSTRKQLFFGNNSITFLFQNQNC